MILAPGTGRQKTSEAAGKYIPASEDAAQQGQDGAHELESNRYSSGKSAFCL